MRRHPAVLSLLLAAVSLAACSDEGDGAGGVTCDYTPCGGDPTGVWTVVEVCGADQLLPLDEIPACRSAVSSGRGTATGTETFAADGTYRRDIRLGGRFSYELPEACADALSEGAGAESYCATLALVFGTMAGTADCRFEGTTCFCELDLDMELPEEGTWAVEGESLITTSDEFDEPAASPFCVSGTDLMLGAPGEDAVALTR